MAWRIAGFPYPDASTHRIRCAKTALLWPPRRHATLLRLVLNKVLHVFEPVRLVLGK